jgi:hypothetical protein
LRPTPNLEDQVSVFIFSNDRVARLYPQTLGSLFIAFYYSQGGILTHLHKGSLEIRCTFKYATSSSSFFSEHFAIGVHDDPFHATLDVFYIGEFSNKQQNF